MSKRLDELVCILTSQAIKFPIYLRGSEETVVSVIGIIDSSVKPGWDGIAEKQSHYIIIERAGLIFIKSHYDQSSRIIKSGIL